MSTSTVSAAATPTRHPFERRVEENKPSKTDINTVIMDYLIKEGYPDSARKFAMEANIKQKPDDESIRTRVEIKHAIQSGNIQSAIEKINELNPEILDLDSTLHFALLRLQLIELIRDCSSDASPENVSQAITFATQQLSPRASTSKAFLEDLQQTMALLVYPGDTLTPQMSELLKPSLRGEVADRVNQAILRRQGQSVEAKIKEWVRARAWAEKEARASHKDVPANLKLVLDGDDEDEESDDGMNGNGDAMIT
ncbi:hypothetical protein EJ08DRAFT_652692 [Tothia fuscella]|uniref:CTLH domain-containing protein n=1 Tax=Tothia fuscella TaxID=1048955 RepID=A0A9P4NJ68_9PEZI|nr:hypothetical protein EJ08DRAFT_652692 [Tothia fuscella]